MGILFSGVPLVFTNGTSVTLRITNARVNAQALAAGSTVQATVSIASTTPFGVNSQPTVASVSASPSTFMVGMPTQPAPGKTIQPLSFTEGFATAFQPKAAAGEDPSVAGTVYQSESGYVNTKVLGSQTGFATNGSRLIVSLAYVPAGVGVYAPLAPSAPTNQAAPCGAAGSAVCSQNLV